MIAAPRVGTLNPGFRDSIADVHGGVTVGHATLADGAAQTGVTVIRPHAGDVYREPLPAASAVLNGFGKTTGLLQLDELGMLESPIALTNTFAVGTIATAMIRHAVALNPAIGRTLPTLNPIVAECNDGWLNDLHAFAVATKRITDSRTTRRRPISRRAPSARVAACRAGDIAIAFATAERIARRSRNATTRKTIGDDALDPLFDAAAEATEQAIVNALFTADTVEGRDGHVRTSITERLPDWRTEWRPR